MPLSEVYCEADKFNKSVSELSVRSDMNEYSKAHNASPKKVTNYQALNKNLLKNEEVHSVVQQELQQDFVKNPTVYLPISQLVDYRQKLANFTPFEVHQFIHDIEKKNTVLQHRSSDNERIKEIREQSRLLKLAKDNNHSVPPRTKTYASSKPVRNDCAKQSDNRLPKTSDNLRDIEYVRYKKNRGEFLNSVMLADEDKHIWIKDPPETTKMTFANSVLCNEKLFAVKANEDESTDCRPTKYHPLSTKAFCRVADIKTELNEQIRMSPGLSRLYLKPEENYLDVVTSPKPQIQDDSQQTDKKALGYCRRERPKNTKMMDYTKPRVFIENSQREMNYVDNVENHRLNNTRLLSPLSKQSPSDHRKNLNKSYDFQRQINSPLSSKPSFTKKIQLPKTDALRVGPLRYGSPSPESLNFRRNILQYRIKSNSKNHSFDASNLKAHEISANHRKELYDLLRDSTELKKELATEEKNAESKFDQYNRENECFEKTNLLARELEEKSYDMVGIMYIMKKKDEMINQVDSERCKEDYWDNLLAPKQIQLRCQKKKLAKILNDRRKKRLAES